MLRRCGVISRRMVSNELKMIRNEPWMKSSIINSMEEENRLLQFDVLILRNEKKKMTIEFVDIKKLDETVAHKDRLLEAHIKHILELMKEIEEHKKSCVDLELAFEKQKDDILIQLEMVKDIAASLDFMIKITNKE